MSDTASHVCKCILPSSKQRFFLNVLRHSSVMSEVLNLSKLDHT